MHFESRERQWCFICKHRITSADRLHNTFMCLLIPTEIIRVLKDMRVSKKINKINSFQFLDELLL